MSDEQLAAWIVSNMPPRFSITRLKEVMRADGVQPPTSCIRWLNDNGYQQTIKMWSRII